jgi:transposase-like protein
VLKFAPELNKRLCPHLSQTHDSWRVDETDIQVKGEWKYPYQAVDSMGNMLDFMPSAKRDGRVAARFFRNVLKAQPTQTPRVSRYASCEALTVDKNAAYLVAMEPLKADETITKETE